MENSSASVGQKCKYKGLTSFTPQTYWIWPQNEYYKMTLKTKMEWNKNTNWKWLCANRKTKSRTSLKYLIKPSSVIDGTAIHWWLHLFDKSCKIYLCCIGNTMGLYHNNVPIWSIGTLLWYKHTMCLDAVCCHYCVTLLVFFIRLLFF